MEQDVTSGTDREQEGGRFRDIVFQGRPTGRRPTSKRAKARERAQQRGLSVPFAQVRPGLPSAATTPHLEDIPEDAARFLRLAMSRAGLNGHHYRLAPLIRRLTACLRALRVGSLPQAQRLLEAEPARWPAVADALLIGTTSFFRDRPVFDALRRLLPEILNARGGMDVWSVGCSDGAELYSVALLLAELGIVAHSRLRGTDCRLAAVERARAGAFHISALATTPPELRRKYFSLQRHRVVLTEEIRRQTEWKAADALGCRDLEAWDLILCRNLAIYLDPGAVATLWSDLTASLRPGGILVVGKAERPVEPPLRRLAPCIYVKDCG